MRGWSLEIGLLCTRGRSQSSPVGPQISHNGHAIAGTELESEGDGHRHELLPTEEVHAIKDVSCEIGYKACRPVMIRKSS